MNEVLESILNLFFPIICLNCGRSADKILCSDCLAVIPRLPPVTFPAKSPLIELNSFGVYRGPLQILIKRFKFQRIHSLVNVLSALLFQIITRVDNFSDDTILVPVPLYFEKERERGFNQSQVLASRLSKMSAIKWRALLVRVKDTPPLYSLSRSERSRVLKNAFEPVNVNLIQNRRVILVDDVFTTGATLFSCARTIKSAGAARVSAVTIARA